MDSSSIIDVVKKGSYPRDYCDRIARMCGERNNPRVSVNCVRRSSNTVAHTLANWAVNEPLKT
ncbi:hypothetical protein L195_g043921 [Trifolium pratense]|uniref:RNase H type-1 domain-containing protein n=1 Tax=Trifolium pratense TaxID=57577 RepID=A0A2K3MAL0_TRIPR|nr:hypothetical protein L195_g043921 [Trifolium pratense]